MSSNSKKGGSTTLAPPRLKEEKKESTQKPPMYRVIFHNDDYTPMDFVVSLLEQYFHHGRLKAIEIMMNVHRKGKGIAGVYTREIAETKAHISMSEARQHEFPLKVSIEEDS